MKFYVKRLPSGRVYLSQISPSDSEELVSEIDAEAWIAARESLRPHGIETFEHSPEHGYY